MRKIIYILTLLVSTYFSSCSRGEVESVFDKSADERITDTLSFIKNTLVGSEYGWIGYTTTDLSGGFGFYFDFDDKDRVKMVADITNTSAAEIKESTYRVRQVMAATLSFDTYNYLTMLQDPTPSTLGGSAGKGFGSDVEFEYVRNSGDTLFFQGRKFKKDFILIKASSEDQSKYTSGKYLTNISTFKEVFNKIKNAYIEVDVEGQKNRIGVSLIFDGAIATRKSGAFTYVDVRNKAITNASKKIAFLLDGLVFLEGGVKVYDFTFVAIKHVNAQTLVVYDSNGNEYIINESSTPIIPLYKQIGLAYSIFNVPGPRITTIPLDTWGTDYITRYNSFKNAVKTGRLNLDLETMAHTFNASRKQLEIMIDIYQGANRFVAGFVYDYEVSEEGVFRFKNRRNNNDNGGLIATDHNIIDERFGKDDFTIDYVEDPVHGQVVEFKSVQNTDFYFTAFIP